MFFEAVVEGQINVELHLFVRFDYVAPGCDTCTARRRKCRPFGLLSLGRHSAQREYDMEAT